MSVSRSGYYKWRYRQEHPTMKMISRQSDIELMKKDIEIARLKKGYNVKGVGQEKEFVTTFNKNTK